MTSTWRPGRDGLDRALTVILVICAVTVTAMALRRQLTPPIDPLGTRTIDNWRTLAATGHRAGPATATVSIVEFADFECPSCAAARFALDSLRRLHPRDVALIYRHYPLQMIHKYAIAAANAAECAGRQGRFFEMSEVLFAEQWNFGKKMWNTLASEAGVTDARQFNQCLSESLGAQNIDRDAAVADSLNIIGTPALIINGKMRIGAVPLSRLEKDFKVAMKAARQVSGHLLRNNWSHVTARTRILRGARAMARPEGCLPLPLLQGSS